MSGAKDAFIHIGLAKTGTKSIQFAMAQRRSRLVRAGWLYPKEGTTNNRSGHHGLAWFLSGATHFHPGLQRFSMSAFKQAMNEASGRNILISSEDLSGLSRDGSAIEALLACFPMHRVSVIVYVREQAEMLNSMYAQMLDTLVRIPSFDDYVTGRLQADAYNYVRSLALWKRQLGERLIVRPFDVSVLKDADVVTDFANQVGIEDVIRPFPTQHKNTSPTSFQVAVLIAFSERLSGIEDRWDLYSPRHRHIRRVVADILKEPKLDAGGPYWGFDPELLARARAQYRTSNAELFSSLMLGDFEFSAVGKAKRRNVARYEDLDAGLRQKLEHLLTQGLATAPAQ